MGAFTMLSQNPFGTKLTKFKQAKLAQTLTDMFNYGTLSPRDFLIVADGQCLAYVMEWLRQRLVGAAPGDPVFRAKGTGSFGTVKGDTDLLLKAVAQMTFLHRPDPAQPGSTAPKSVVENVLRLAAMSGLEFADAGREPGGDWKALWNKLPTLGEGGFLIAAELTDGKGHALGWINRPGQDKPLFFDSNLGEYEVNDITGFRDKYAEGLASKFKWTIRSALYFAFRKA